MGERTVMPFGPQHPALPEPIHIDLVLEDEKIVEAVPSIGFIHRGLEKLVEKREFIEYVYVAERICGICSFTHGMGYCQAVENIMDIKVPEKAEYLRTIWSELARVQSHVLWFGLLADACGFESLFMHTWKAREIMLDMFDMTTGGRIIFSVCKIGGVRKDIDGEKLKKFEEMLLMLEEDMKQLLPVFVNDNSMKSRLEGVGTLTKQDAMDLGCVGPMARASGLDVDTRRLGYCAYPQVGFETSIETAGDCMARTKVRMNEVFEAIQIIKKCIQLMPKEGAIDVPVKGFPNGEYLNRVEQPRGEVCYYVKANGTKFLERFRVRTPTFANVPSLLKMLKGADLADVPIIVLTIDPCISCTERSKFYGIIFNNKYGVPKSF